MLSSWLGLAIRPAALWRLAHRWEIRGVLVLEVKAPGHARSAARGIVRPCPFAQSARKIFIGLSGRDGYPCLVVAGAGFKPKEGNGLYPVQPFPAQIVELDEHGAGGYGAHYQVAFIL